MISFPMFVLLGYCTGYVPGDAEMTIELCKGQWEAQYRDIGEDDGFDYDWFYKQVAEVRWPRR